MQTGKQWDQIKWRTKELSAVQYKTQKWIASSIHFAVMNGQRAGIQRDRPLAGCGPRVHFRARAVYQSTRSIGHNFLWLCYPAGLIPGHSFLSYPLPTGWHLVWYKQNKRKKNQRKGENKTNWLENMDYGTVSEVTINSLAPSLCYLLRPVYTHWARSSWLSALLHRPV